MDYSYTVWIPLLPLILFLILGLTSGSIKLNFQDTLEHLEWE